MEIRLRTDGPSDHVHCAAFDLSELDNNRRA
jgi:hypothetical protein